MLEKYKRKVREKDRKTHRSSTTFQIESNYKALVDKIRALAEKVELIESQSNATLKGSSTFNSNFIKNLDRKRKHFESYQQQFEGDRPRVMTQYDRLR